MIIDLLYLSHQDIPIWSFNFFLASVSSQCMITACTWIGHKSVKTSTALYFQYKLFFCHPSCFQSITCCFCVFCFSFLWIFVLPFGGKYGKLGHILTISYSCSGDRFQGDQRQEDYLIEGQERGCGRVWCEYIFSILWYLKFPPVLVHLSM